ncbi:thymidylate synthase [Streptomyces sp. NPDC048385]|uniref:thymidylate synthase n=1 Tax=unclassified Streptomyces TaxID=2593676 RepID=UPI00341737BF
MQSVDNYVPEESIFGDATLTCRSLSEAIPRVLDYVVRHGRPAYVRGELNLEVLGVDIAILDPADRLPIVPGRREISAFCLVEFLWYAAKRTDLEPLEVYAPNISSFYGGMRSVTGSDYGGQLFGGDPGSSQWDMVIALLRHDPGSKRAFMALFDRTRSATLMPSNLDVSCTTGFQAIIREGQLHWVTSMRANDAYRGFVSDTFSFTMFHELLASALEIQIGHYLHRPTSLHTFPEDEAAIRKILAGCTCPVPTTTSRMPPIRHRSFWEHLPAFWAAHDCARLAGDFSLLTPAGEIDDPWWQWTIDLLSRHHDSAGGDSHAA